MPSAGGIRGGLQLLPKTKKPRGYAVPVVARTGFEPNTRGPSRSRPLPNRSITKDSDGAGSRSVPSNTGRFRPPPFQMFHTFEAKLRDQTPICCFPSAKLDTIPDKSRTRQGEAF